MLSCLLITGVLSYEDLSYEANFFSDPLFDVVTAGISKKLLPKVASYYKFLQGMKRTLSHEPSLLCSSLRSLK